MLHRLCGPPSIPLSFNLAAVLPRRCAYRVGCDTGGLGPPTSSAHRLRRGLPGYLILFAPHAFAPQRQLRSREPPSPPVFFPISTNFTSTLGIPLSSPVLEPSSIKCHSQVEPGAFTSDFKRPPARPLRPVIPNNARPLRITAAAGTKLAGASSHATVIIVACKRALQPEGLHRPRGIAGSGLPPLSNIPHCCLP
jgi:hypothetical protein